MRQLSRIDFSDVKKAIYIHHAEMFSKACYYDIFTREWGASLSEIHIFVPENRPFAPKGHVIFQPSMFHVQVLLQLDSRRANKYKKTKKVVPEIRGPEIPLVSG